MLAAQRKARILAEVSTSGALRISDLAESLGVSEVTIRRDVEQLAAQNLVDKVHGGVTANALSSTMEPPFAANSMKEQEAKDAIAAAASDLVRPGMAIALMGGSSVYALAKLLRDVPSLTIVTNSVPKAAGRSDRGAHRWRPHTNRLPGWQHRVRCLLQVQPRHGLHGLTRH